MIYRTSYLKILCSLPAIVLSFLFYTGCAHIPKDSVELSSAVNKGIQNQQTAYQNLYNSYFNLKKEKIDEWIKSKYTPQFISNVRSVMTAGGKNEIDDEGMNYIINAIIERRDSMQLDLEKTKSMLWERISQDQLLLLNSSQQVTSLLKSIVDVEESTNQLLQNTGKAAGIDFMKIDEVFNEYLLKAGDVSKKGTSLIEGIKPLLKGEK